MRWDGEPLHQAYMERVENTVLSMQGFQGGTTHLKATG